VPLKFFLLAILFALVLSASDEPLRFNPNGEMLFPANYREWVWLSSGLGMNYRPSTEPDNSPDFDNVFVSPQAYRAFVATGVWPNGAVFMLEIRSSRSKGSINLSGHYQGEVESIEAHVKKPDGSWGFYSFGKESKPARMIPLQAGCYSCHEQHGAVDTTFVQFYPTLLPIALAKKTVNEKAFAETNK
jgi:hypothetical protein